MISKVALLYSNIFLARAIRLYCYTHSANESTALRVTSQRQRTPRNHTYIHVESCVLAAVRKTFLQSSGSRVPLNDVCRGVLLHETNRSMIYEGNSVIAYRSNSWSAQAIVKHDRAIRAVRVKLTQQLRVTVTFDGE